VLPYPDICDIRTWWPLSPAETTSRSLIALISPYTTYYCGLGRNTAAYIRNYRDAGFVGILGFFPPEVTSAISVVNGPLYTDFFDSNFFLWLCGPQSSGTLPFAYALETFFVPNSTTLGLVKVQLTFDEWNCPAAFVSSEMEACYKFGVACSLMLVAATTYILWTTRYEPLSLARTALVIEGVVAAPFRAFKGLLDPVYVVPTVNLDFSQFFYLVDLLLSHVANTIVTFIFCELVFKIWRGARPGRWYRTASNGVLAGFVLGFSVPPFVYLYQLGTIFNGVTVDALLSGSFLAKFLDADASTFNVTLYFSVTMIGLNCLSCLVLVVLMTRAGRTGSTMLADKARVMSRYMVAQIVCYVPLITAMVVNPDNVQHFTDDESGCLWMTVGVYVCRIVGSNLLGVLVVASLHSYSRKAEVGSGGSGRSGGSGEAGSSSSSSSSSSSTSTSTSTSSSTKRNSTTTS